MAITYGVRWKPQVGRSSLETLIQGFDPATGAGTLVLTAQAVMYDDARYNPAVAVPGKPEDEAELAILAEEPILFDAAILAGRTQAQINAGLADALDAWATRIKPAGPGLMKVFRGVRSVGMRAIP